MFTGLVEEIGRVVSIQPQGKSIRVMLACEAIREGMRVGDSIAVDGCCLTAETVDSTGFSVFTSPETMAKTSLGDRRPGDGVNLERAMALGDCVGSGPGGNASATKPVCDQVNNKFN